MDENNPNLLFGSELNANFDIKEYLNRVLRLWPLAVSGILICLLGTYIILKYIIPKYHIQAKLLIEEDKKAGSSDMGQILDLGGLLGGKSSVDNEAEVLNTRFLLEQLVKDMKLNIIWSAKDNLIDKEFAIDPYEIVIEDFADTVVATRFIFTQLNTKSFSLKYTDPKTDQDFEGKYEFGKLFRIKKYGEFRINRNKNSPKEIGMSLNLDIMSIDRRVSGLKQLFDIAVTNKVASTINITFDYPEPLKGENILKNFIHEYIHQNIMNKSLIADSTIAFIDKRILIVNDDLNAIEERIQGFKQNSGLADISEQSKLLLANSSENIKELSSIETQISMLNEIENQLNSEKGGKLVVGSILSSDPSFNQLINQYNSLNLERERFLLSYTPDNPVVENEDKRIISIKEDIKSYIKSSRGTLEVSKRGLERNSNSMQSNIQKVPVQERAFLDLSRQQQIKQELYVFLLQKREETAVTKTSNIAGIRIIDPPKADNLPFSPRKKLILAAAFILGLMIPMGWIYLQDIFDTTTQSRKDVEKRTQVPIVGEISHNDGAEEVSFNASRSAIAEQFRGLRTNLQFLLGNGNSKVILVTSGQPGEGKSFISLNLARVYAVSGKKVLLLEFDLRKPKLSATYNTYGHTGLTNYLVNPEIDYKSFLITTDIVNGQLSFAPSGPIPPNPSELILNGSLPKFFEQAKRDFDYVIVDAPPVGAVTDAQLLSIYSDVCLYLVRCGVTPHEVLKIPEDLRLNHKIKNLGIVLNDISEHAPGYYGYGYYHNEDVKSGKWSRLFAKIISKRK